ncbi:MAG TPA: twin-arginine translocase subunit TatC [Vicinamibacterales bacterium]|nr:twin-arginine translocase subunit TatC [Vicinamibacterales bacterium]
MSTPASETFDDVQEDEKDQEGDRSRMSFLEHLDEFRRRLLYSVYALTATCAVTFYYWEPIYRYLAHYLKAQGGTLMFSQPMAGFMFSLKTSALLGVIIASPFIFTQLWLFIAPGLYAKEKRVVVPFVFFSTLLFIAGAYFAHAVGFPAMAQFFASYGTDDIAYMPQLDVIFSLYVKVVLGMGVAFQLPMLVFFLARFGMVTAGYLLRKFKYAFLIIVIAAAVATPSGDPVTLTVFSAPMVLLYLISILVAWVFGKRQKKEDD